MDMKNKREENRNNQPNKEKDEMQNALLGLGWEGKDKEEDKGAIQEEGRTASESPSKKRANRETLYKKE
jgi:hypothetical protein